LILYDKGIYDILIHSCDLGGIAGMTEIFKTKSFARWARKEGLTDRDLVSAIAESEHGELIEVKDDQA
jgi:hypothetical protein